MNLGSPAEASTGAIRSFLRRFLSDTRVIDVPKPIWQTILNAFILPVRPKKILPEYQRVWMEEGAPLTVFTERQAEMLASERPDVEVRWAMCYSQPSIAQGLRELEEAGCDDVTIIHAYPHYAPSTVAPIFDQVAAYYRDNNYIPALYFVNSFPDDAQYAAWYADRIAAELAKGPADLVVFSYHGLPDRPAHWADGYVRQCAQTSAAIVATLAKRGAEVESKDTFQSKFGPGEWLKPATIDTMRALPGQGVKDVIVATPGFLADCLETASEIEHLNRAAFMDAGGRTFRRIHPLNDSPEAGPLLASLLPD